MGYYRDLREYLHILEERGKLIRITRQINKDTQLHPLVRWQFRGLSELERKAFLFENVVDSSGHSYDIPVVVGCYASSREVYALGMGCEASGISDKWEQAQLRPIEPELIPTGPVHEVIHMGKDLVGEGKGLEALPVPISTPGFDNTPYLTACQWVTKDPETGKRNVGNYRSQVKSSNRTGMFASQGQHIGLHWEKYRKMGKPLQAAIIIGGVPSVAYTAVTKLPYDVDEYAVAGGIAGEPIPLVKCKTVDLEVPATAEIVLEGEISTEYFETEGPFGEFTGYMGSKGMTSFFDVKCITHRRNPIYVSIISQFPPSESSKIRQVGAERVLHKYLKYEAGFTDVLDVAYLEPSGSMFVCVVRLRRSDRTVAREVLETMASSGRCSAKLIVAVDEDVDPWDADSVIWALSLAMQPQRDTWIRPNEYVVDLDYSIAPIDDTIYRGHHAPSLRTGSALLIDATRKWDYPPVSLPSRRHMEEAREIWNQLGLPSLTPRTPWSGYPLGYWQTEDEEEARLATEGKYRQLGDKMKGQRKPVQ